jgi:hypothetical protein
MGFQNIRRSPPLVKNQKSAQAMLKTSLSLVFCFLAFSALAQVQLGFAVGMSTTAVDPSDLIITDQFGADALVLKLESANYGVHGGLVLRIPIKKFFLQPQVFFHSNSADFRVTDLNGGPDRLLRESYQNLNIPFLLGYKLGPLRLQAGPVGHVFLHCNSQLDQIEGYEKIFEPLTYGWQAGLGLDIWKLFIDLNYEGNLSNFGDHIHVFGAKFAFDERPNRFVASVGFFF